MNARASFFALGMGLLLSSWVLGQAPTADPARIDALVRQLGSSSYAQREDARRQLEALGTPALEPLRKLTKAADVETARRLTEVVGRLEEQLLTRQILTPKEVHLKLKDAGVQQAIAELASVSGYPIQFQGDLTKFAGKKITLDTGKTSFWQAFDQLNEQAGLMERVDQANATQSIRDLPGRGGLRRIQTFPPPQPGPAGPIIVTNRTSEKSFVSHAGAVKTELRVSRAAAAKELNLQFLVSIEPRLLNSGIVGSPILQKALDQHSQELRVALDLPKAAPKTAPQPDDIWVDMAMPMMSQQGRRVTQLRVQEGPQAARAIKELTGKLGLQLDLQNVVLARMDNVLEAAGKSVAGANSGTMKVNSVRKQPNGDIEVQVSIENLTPNPFGGNIVMNGNGGVIIRGNVIINGGMVIGPNGVRINGAGNNRDLPDLLDAKGQKFRVANLLADSFNLVNGSSTRNATIVFQANPGQAEPRELVLFGARTHAISVPFRFENLPLP